MKPTLSQQDDKEWNEYNTKYHEIEAKIKLEKLQDDIKKVELTEEQYKTWLETDIFYITTEQFEILYGMNKQKQASLRSHIRDPLPSFQVHGKGKHYYNKLEVDKWLSNYKRASPFS